MPPPPAKYKTKPARYADREREDGRMQEIRLRVQGLDFESQPTLLLDSWMEHSTAVGFFVRRRVVTTVFLCSSAVRAGTRVRVPVRAPNFKYSYKYEYVDEATVLFAYSGMCPLHCRMMYDYGY